MDTTTLPDQVTLDDLHSKIRRSLQRLRTTLRLNGATSLAGGLVAAVAPSSLDRLLGTGHPGWVRLVGIGLALYAFDLLVLAGRRASAVARWTPYVVGADVAWVLASFVGIAAGWFSGSGSVLVLAVALTVGTFAWFQQRALADLQQPGRCYAMFS